MKVLIDTNILLDVLCNRPGLAESSAKVWKHIEAGNLEGIVCALSIPNIVYILRKELDPEKVREVIAQLDHIFAFTDLKAGDLRKAITFAMKDYEDAVQAACALRNKAQFVITRNLKDFAGSPVPAIKPEELLERIEIAE